jgi:hypothetical protein
MIPVLGETYLFPFVPQAKIRKAADMIDPVAIVTIGY